MINLLNNKFGRIKSIYILRNCSKKNRSSYVDILDQDQQPTKILFLSNLDLINLVFWNICNKNAVFVLHGYDILLLVLSCICLLRKCKLKWVCWGTGVKKHKKNLSGIFYNCFKRVVYRTLDEINCLMISDAIDLIEKHQVSSKKVSIIPYPSSFENSYISEIKNYFADDTFNILVGNSAAEQNHHLEIFNLLSRFRNESIRVISFLNYGYGDGVYREEVIRRGYKLFRSKFFPITELVKFEEYLSIMKSVNFTIINSEKQRALGAIYVTIRSKGIVFLNSGGKNARWMEYLGIRTKKIEDIKKAKSIKALNDFKDEQLVENKSKLERLLNEKRLTDEWVTFFVSN